MINSIFKQRVKIENEFIKNFCENIGVLAYNKDGEVNLNIVEELKEKGYEITLVNNHILINDLNINKYFVYELKTEYLKEDGKYIAKMYYELKK